MNYPAELRAKYKSFLHTDAVDGADGAVFVSEDLCCEILRDKSNFTQISKRMIEAHSRYKRQAVQAYVTFVESQGTAAQAKLWPDFGWDNFDRLFKPPTNKTLTKIFFRCFN